MQTCIWPSGCHCHSLSLASVKSRLVFPFWYRLTRVVPDKGPLNGCVCVTFKKVLKLLCNLISCTVVNLPVYTSVTVLVPNSKKTRRTHCWPTPTSVAYVVVNLSLKCPASQLLIELPNLCQHFQQVVAAGCCVLSLM